MAVDPAHRVVTNVALTRGAQEDVDMLLPLLDGTLEKYEKLGLSPDSIGTVDANYASGRNLMEVARRGIEYYGPHKVEYDKKVYPLSRFKYNPEGDYYTCPHCKRLNFRSTTRHLGKGFTRQEPAIAPAARLKRNARPQKGDNSLCPSTSPMKSSSPSG